MKKPLVSSSRQRAKWRNLAPVYSDISVTSVEGNRALPRIDESPLNSENHLQWDEESLHSSILDSTHVRGDSEIQRRVDDHNTTRIMDWTVAQKGCDCFPSKFRGWNCKPRRTKSKPVLQQQDTEGTMSPLLNPNAIHERKSLNMMHIHDEQDWSCNNEEQENKVQKVNRENQFESFAIDWKLASTSTASSPCNRSYTAASVFTLSPSFAKHERQGNFQALDSHLPNSPKI